MKYLIDSWGWIEFFQQSKIGSKIREMLENEDNEIIVSSINIAEVYKFILREKDLSYAEKALDLMMKRCFIIFVSTQIAVESARLNNKFKIGLGDSIIYATSQLNQAVLVTGDEHFKDKKGVEFIG